MNTHYDALGVPRQASHIEIELGYRRYLNRHLAGLGARPPGRRAQLRLQAARQAYLVLSSPGRRRAYDLELAQHEQRRNRMLDIGGAILAVSSLVIGMGLIVASPYFPTWPDFTEDLSRQVNQVRAMDAVRIITERAMTVSTAAASR